MPSVGVCIYSATNVYSKLSVSLKDQTISIIGVGPQQQNYESTDISSS